MKQNQLHRLRKQIDQIDNQLVILLAQRIKVVKKIGEWKKKKGLPPLDKKRWRQILASKMTQAKKLGLNPNLIKKIYQTIHNFALKIEAKAK